MKRSVQLAQFVKALREALNLTQQELADKLEVGRTTIASWEREVGYPGADSLVKLALLKGWMVEDLQRYLITGQLPTDDPLEKTLLLVRELPPASVIKVIQEGMRVLALVHSEPF